ncbi:hypothetical protein Tco_0681227 [Tanacetum coccineum]|uniref:Retrotransposon gag domain-containing protein n=1 Tax=Tanacetum coccineum TaxID=301880 RepID=A0ABQ4XP17_9ASTR
MASKEGKSTTRKIGTNDQADYYSGITSITVNGKNVYELEKKFLDDLHKNAFSGTHGEDAVEHIEYFLKIVDPINLPNVNQDKLRIVVFPISLAGDAWRWFDGIKGSITSWVDFCAKFFGKYYPPSRTGKVETLIIKWDPTNPKFENWLASKFVYYQNYGYIYTKGALWEYWKLGSDEIKPTNEETADLEETNHDNEQEIGDESSNNGWRRWDGYEIADHDQERGYENEHEDEERCELFDDHELPVCTIRRFEMIKYSFRDDEEYVAVKEDEYDDLTSTSKDACRAYKEIFRVMDEGWMDLAEKKSTMLVENLRSRNFEVLES